MMNKEEKEIQFGREVQKFQSLLHSVKINTTNMDVVHNTGKFADISLCRVYFDNYVLGLTMNLSTESVEAWINEDKVGWNVEERAELLSLFAKFYQKVTLNGHI